MRKTFVILLVILAILAVGAYFIGRTGAQAPSQLQTEAIQRGDLTESLNATGLVHSNQTTTLAWKTTGTIGEVNVKAGDSVRAGQVLALLEPASLSQSILSARANLINAQKNLEDLQHSKLQAAEAQQALEDAQHALEDARDPELAQANAQRALAEAEKNVEDAKTQLTIVQSKPPQTAIDQAYANMILAENVLDQTKSSITRLQNRLNRPPSTYYFFESKEFYRRILENLNFKLVRDQRAYEEAADKYNSLLEPADPNDLLVAQANVAKAKAELAKAQRDWERVKDGPDPADIAVLEAGLADAQRAWERLKDGPDPADLAAAQAQVDSAQSVVNQATLTAPFNGTITEVSGMQGDQVAPGTTMFRLDDLSRLAIDLQISEIDINNLRAGMLVQVTFDAIPANVRSADAQASGLAVYQGQVTEVLSYGQEIQGGVFYQATVELIDPDQYIKPGITASADLVVRQLKDVLQIPNSSIRFSGGQQIVYLMRNGQPTPVPVQLGATSGTDSEVQSGDLSEGDLILIDPPAGLPEYQPSTGSNSQ